MPDDYSANARTTGTVAVGGSATGTIGTRWDIDWFAVELVAGRTYVIDLEGDDTGGGTLGNTMLSGLYDSAGERIAGTRVGYGGEGDNARLVFIASESGTHYVAARGQGGETGTYTVRVTEFVDADGTRSGARDLGDITAQSRPSALQDSLDGEADRADYFRFTLSEAKKVKLNLRKQEENADLYLEDGNGTVLHASKRNGTRNEGIEETLQAGTYYVRVVAQEAGANSYALYHRVADPDPERPPGGNPAPQPQQSVSEPDGEDFPADTSTKGRVAVGGSATGAYAFHGDIDWFAVTLEKDTAYRIDVKGSSTGDGTLRDPLLRGVGDADGNYIAGTWNAYGGKGRNSRTFFTPSEDGIHYVVAGNNGYGNGTYTVSVAEVGADDFAGDTTTNGTVPVDGSVTGEIETPGDRDWFKVTLEKGKTYRIDMKEHGGNDALSHKHLFGVHDADGSFVAGPIYSWNHSWMYFTASADAAYYVAAGSRSPDRVERLTGTYTLSVTEILDDYAANTGTAGRVAVDGSVTGEIDAPGDRDWFAVTLEKGKVYRIDLEGAPTKAGTLQDPYFLGMHDANGNYIARTKDYASGTGKNSQLFFTADADATYYMAVGNGTHLPLYRTGTYTLSVAEVAEDDFTADTETTGTVPVDGSVTGAIGHPDDRDWFAVTLEKGKTYRIDLKGSSTGDGTLDDPSLLGVHDASGNIIARTKDYGSGTSRNSQLFFTADADATYYVAAGSGKYLPLNSTGTYTLSVAEVSEDDFTGGTETTGTVPVDGSVTGEIETPGDRDWFKVTLEKGKVYRIDLKGQDTGDGTLDDPYLYGIYEENGKSIDGTGDDDSGSSRNSRVLFPAYADGVHYVAVGGDRERTGAYTLSVAEIGTDDYPGKPGTSGTGAVEVGGSATGEIETPGDRDWFAVTLEAGTTYRIDLEGAPTKAGTLRDPVLYGVRDANGNDIADTGNDNGGVDGNARTIFTPGEDGIYYIAPNAHAGAGNVGTYTLSVIDISDDHAADTGTTGRVAVGGSTTGEIELPGDRDWFRAELSAGTWYQIDLEGAGSNPAGVAGEAGELQLAIYDSNGNRLTIDEYAGWGWDSSRLLFKAPADGVYYIGAGEVQGRVHRHVHPEGGGYELSLDVAQPASHEEIAGFLTDDYWRAGGRRAFDPGPDRTLDVDITALTDGGKRLAGWALEAWSNVTGIEFRFVRGNADITFDDEHGGAHSNSKLSGDEVESGFVNVAKSRVSLDSGVNSYTFGTYMHEIGHVLGLGHAGKYNGATSFPDGVVFPNDSRQASVMSYFEESANPNSPAVNTFVGGKWYYITTPMIADILAMHTLYGAPAASNAGDTVYGWNGDVGGYLGHLLTELTGGKPDVDVYASRGDPRWNDNPVALTLYDTGGTDTLDLRTDTHDQRVDLRPEGSSEVFGRNGKIFIGPDTVIENFTAGSGNDRVTGNDAANRLKGRKGDDTLEGGGGDDRLTGGAGRDVFVFGPGNGADTVTDFTDAEDRIDLRAFAAITGFSDVDAEAVSGGVEIDLSAHGGGTVLLDGFALANLDPGDFLFHG